MRYIKTFESYNTLNENIFSSLFKNNNSIKTGIELSKKFFSENPQELEKLKRDTSGEIQKFSPEEIKEFTNKLTTIEKPITPQLKDAAQQVIDEVNESTVVSNAIRYLAQKFLDFLGVTSFFGGLITSLIGFLLGNANYAQFVYGLPEIGNPLVFLGMMIGGIIMVITGSKILKKTRGGEYDDKTKTYSKGSLDQFSGEHTMRYY